MSQDLEKALLEAGDRLGELMGQTTGREKEVLQEMHAQLQKFSQEKQSEGVNIDVAAFFACSIITHPEIQNPDLIRAAGDYIDKDYMFCKSLRTAK